MASRENNHCVVQYCISVHFTLCDITMKKVRHNVRVYSCIAGKKSKYFVPTSIYSRYQVFNLYMYQSVPKMTFFL